MTRYKTYRVRIFPNIHQRRYIHLVMDARRKVYNTINHLHRDEYIRTDGRSLSSVTIRDVIEQHPWMKKIPQYLLCESKHKIDEAFHNMIHRRNQLIFEMFPKYHSCNAGIPDTYVDRDNKFIVKFNTEKNDNGHYTVTLPHLGNVEALKLPVNSILQTMNKHKLEYGVTFKYVNVKIIKSFDSKYYATLLYQYEDDTTTEYDSIFFKNIVFHQMYQPGEYPKHVIGIDDITSLKKLIVCKDSDGLKYGVSKHIKSLIASIKRLSDKYTRQCKCVYLKIQQLRNAIDELTRNIARYYLLNYNVIALPNTSTYYRNHLQLIHNSFRKHLIQYGSEIEHCIVDSVSVISILDQIRDKHFNLSEYVKNNEIEQLMKILFNRKDYQHNEVVQSFV